MTTAIKQHVTVGPGGRIELHAAELHEGQLVEVTVSPEPGPATKPRRTLTSFIGSAPGRFKTVEEVDRYIRELRDEWDQ